MAEAKLEIPQTKGSSEGTSEFLGFTLAKPISPSPSDDFIVWHISDHGWMSVQNNITYGPYDSKSECVDDVCWYLSRPTPEWVGEKQNL